MVAYTMNLLSIAFRACASWVTELFEATQLSGLILSVLIMCISISLLLIPLRGMAQHGSYDSDTKISKRKKGG